MFRAESDRRGIRVQLSANSYTFQWCLMCINATANKKFQLTAGKFVPLSNVTMMNVCRAKLRTTNYTHKNVLRPDRVNHH